MDDPSWKDFVESAAVGVTWLGPDGRILWVNPAQLELLGYARDQIVGRHLADLLADPATFGDVMVQLLSGRAVCALPAQLLDVRGDARHVEIDARPFHREGILVHIGCFIRDVTEQRRTEAAVAEQARVLQAAARLKDEFLATVSHELRAPLNAILGWSKLLLAGRVDERKHTQALATIERNAAAQARLIDELLDLARIANDKLRLEVHPVELGDVVSSAVESMRPAADTKGVRISCVVEPEVGPFLGDKSRLAQVLWNLVSNAVKFTPEGGEVHVHLSRIDDQALIVVSDTGQGIAPEFLPYVFDRFRQAEAGMNRQHGGLGLGLAITRHLVEAHGGRVDVASAGPGSGTTFSVVLPLLSIAPEAAPAVAASRPMASQLEGVKVLVVDDDHDAREVVAETLRLCGAHVEESASSQAALAQIHRAPPDVLVADIGLPVEDGYMLIERIRAAGLSLPACALTAYARPEDREKALSAGFDMHQAKPLDPQTLCEAVAQLAASRRPG